MINTLTGELADDGQMKGEDELMSRLALEPDGL